MTQSGSGLGGSVHASISSASYYLRSWLGRWSRARSAALAGYSCEKSRLGMGYPTCPRSGCLHLVHRVRTPPLRNLPRGSAGPSGLTLAGRRGIGVQARSMANVPDARTAPATRNQNSGSNARAHTQPPDLQAHRGRVCPGLDSFYTSSSGPPGVGLEVLSSKSLSLSLSTGARTESLIWVQATAYSWNKNSGL